MRDVRKEQSEQIRRKNTPCLISFSSKGREDYNAALLRNIKYANRFFSGDMLYYSLDADGNTLAGTEVRRGLPNGCPTHKEVPYGFKPWLFKEAYDLGYRKILWMDSTICMVRNPKAIFDRMSRDGYVAFHNIGHDLKHYISDAAVESTGIQLNENPYQIMACVVGFDLDHPAGLELFNKWFELAQDGKSFQNNGSFRHEFKTHRHDQAVLSALLWKMNGNLLPYGRLVYQPHDTNGEYPEEKIYFVNKAVGKE